MHAGVGENMCGAFLVAKRDEGHGQQFNAQRLVSDYFLTAGDGVPEIDIQGACLQKRSPLDRG